MPPRTSSDSVRIISLNRDSLLEGLRAIARRIRAEHPEAAEVRLFGSLARGDQTGTSDIDILIVLERTLEVDPVRRALTFLPYFDLERGTDILVYTRAELAAGSRAVQRLWRESILL